MNVFKIFLLLSLIAMGSTSTAQNQTLHAILVDGGSRASATSIQLCEQRLTQVANTLGITANIIKLKASECGIVNAIRNLRVSSEDLTFFWYAGHGRNSQEDDFPIFNTCSESLGHSDVVSGLKRTGCRLTIVGYDCCNHDAVQRPQTQPAAPPNFEDIWRKMFLEYSGVIRLCSGEPNKYSYEIRGYGGLYTNSFYETLKDRKLLAAQTPKQAWEIFGAVLKERTNAKDTKINVPLQNPLIKIESNTPRGGAGVSPVVNDNTESTRDVPMQEQRGNTPFHGKIKPRVRFDE